MRGHGAGLSTRLGCTHRRGSSCLAVPPHAAAAKGDRLHSSHERWPRQGADGHRRLKDLFLFLLLYRAKIDGTESTKIASFTAGEIPFWPRWSPDGSRLRFTVHTHDKGYSLWEVAADGRNLRPLLSGWNNPPSECCGSWTPDGKYFVFQSQQGQTGNVWAIREAGGLLRKLSHRPVQLTSGPTLTAYPLPSSDGKKIFVIAAHLRGELVHYDSGSHQFTPYLSGISATGVSFSRDGKWMTYSPYPEGGLWRSKVDGTERLQLAFPSQFVYVGLTSWSPDGARIAFMGLGRTKPSNVYLVPAAGGTPETPLHGDRDAAWPNWSPDGKSLLFGRVPWEEKPGVGPMDLEILDLSTHTISKVPGSEDLWDSRWSPDGRYILAKPRAGDRLMLFDFKSQKWTEVAKINVSWPGWSRKGDYIYLNGTPSSGQAGIFRVRISDRKLEQVVSLTDFHQAPAPGNWMGLAPDDSPLLFRDAGTQDIYALDWDAP